MFAWVWENYLVGKESVDICEVVTTFPTLCVSDTVGLCNSKFCAFKILCALHLSDTSILSSFYFCILIYLDRDLYI